MILMENTRLTKQQVAFNSKDYELIKTCLDNNTVVEVVCNKKSNCLNVCFSGAYKTVKASHIEFHSHESGDQVMWNELIYPSVESEKEVKKYRSYN